MVEKIERYLRQLAPHQQEREAATLLNGAKVEIERLQRIIDSRPAINAGLPGTYIEWSQLIYQCDINRQVGHDA